VAQVDPATRNDVDHLLERALAAWNGLADVECEIYAWDLEDQIAFVEEWPHEEERLERLAGLVKAGALDADQQTRYTRLLTLVERNRPVVDRLLRA